MLEPLALQHTVPIAGTLVAIEPCYLLHAEAGSMVQISAYHDDTSISMSASAVDLQNDTHIAQTDGGHDSGPGHDTQCSDAELSSPAQHSNVTDTHAPNQDLSQPLQENEPKPTHMSGKSTRVTALPDACALHHALDRPAVSQSHGDQWHVTEPGASPNRLWMLADADRAIQYDRAVRHVLAGAGPGAVCIASGAGTRLALVAAACGNVQQVICLQVGLQAVWSHHYVDLLPLLLLPLPLLLLPLLLPLLLLLLLPLPLVPLPADSCCCQSQSRKILCSGHGVLCGLAMLLLVDTAAFHRRPVKQV